MQTLARLAQAAVLTATARVSTPTMALPDLHLPGPIYAVAGAALTAMFGWLRSRQRTTAYTMGAVDHAVTTAMASVTDEVGRLNKKIEAVEGKHERCEAELEDGRRERGALRRQIEELMLRPVARPFDQPPGD